MRKKSLVYIVIAVITLGALFLLQYNRPKEINWFESYVATHKIPYGTLIANELITNSLFKNKVVQVHIPPFEFLSKENTPQGTYVFINDNVAFEKAELNELLDWTSQGNTLFIASESFETDLRDTLGIDTKVVYGGFEVAQKQEHQLVNKTLKGEHPFNYEKVNFVTVFEKIDTVNTSALATVRVSENENEKDIEELTAIKKPFGKGEIILSTFPKAFTNYFILEENNKDYTAGLVSYFDDSRNVYMDNHYKSGKAVYTSPMYIFLNTKELKWAYYIVLIGSLLYIVFEGKRKQRAIPLITPLQNQTMAFTKTISDMYFEKGEKKLIVEHKINYFLNYLKSRYYIDNITKGDDFYRRLAARSGNTLEETITLFSYIEKLKNSSQITDNELITLNKLIQKFKSEIDAK